MREFVVFLFLAFGLASSAVWRPGYEYVYDYKAQTLTGIPQLDSQASGVGLRSNVVIQVASERELVVKLKDVEVARAANEVFRTNWMSGRRVPFKFAAAKNGDDLQQPFMIYLTEDGLLQSIQSFANESAWITNIKRAVASQLSLNIREVLKATRTNSTTENLEQSTQSSKCFTVSREPSVTGECDAHYTVGPVARQETNFLHRHPNGRSDLESLILVTKTKDYKNCEEQKSPILGSMSSPYETVLRKWSETQENRIAARTSSWRCMMGRNSSMNGYPVIQEIGSENTVLVHPFATNKESINIVSYQTMELKAVRQIKQAIALQISSLTQHQITYEWENREKFALRNTLGSYAVGPVSNEKVMALVDHVENAVIHSDTYDKEAIPQRMMRLAELLRFFSLDRLQKLYYANIKTEDTSSSLKKSILLDAMAMSGSPASIFFIKDVVARKLVKGETASQLIMSLPSTIQHINSDVLRELIAMIKSVEDPEDEQLWYTALLSVANILHRAVHRSEQQWKQYGTSSNFPEALVDFVSYVEKKFVHSQDPIKQAILVQALANLKSPVALPVLREVAEGRICQCKLVRSTAIFALAQIQESNSERMSVRVQAIIKPLFSNRRENQQVRMSAFTSMLIWHPSEAFFIEAASGTWFETNQQINHFIYSALSSLASNSTHHGFKQVSDMAAMALPLAEPVKLGVPYSSWRIESHQAKSQDFGHLWNFHHLNGQFSILPDQVFYAFFNYAKGAYKPILETLWQSGGIQTLINDIVGSDYQQMLPSLPGLEIKPRRDVPFHGRLWFRLMGSLERCFTLNKLADWAKEGLMNSDGQLRKDLDLDYVKSIMLEQERLVLPIESGLPIYVQKNIPLTLTLRGKMSMNVTSLEPSKMYQAAVDSDQGFVISRVMEAGIMSPLTEDIFQSGHETKIAVNLPGKADLSLKNNKLKVKLEHSSRAPTTLNVLAIRFFPYTGQDTYKMEDSRPFKRVIVKNDELAHKTPLKLYIPGLHFKTWKPTKESAVEVWYSHWLSDALANFETIREMFSGNFLFGTKFNPTLKAAQMRIDVNTGSIKALEATAGYEYEIIRDERQADHDKAQTGASSRRQHRAANFKNETKHSDRSQQVTEFEKAFESDEMIHSLWSTVKFQGSASYGASLKIARSPDSTIWKTLWNLEKNGTSQTKIEGYSSFKYPRLPLRRTRMLQESMTTQGYFMARYHGSGVPKNSTLSGDVILSQTNGWHQRALRSVESQQCVKHEKQGEPYSPTCLTARQQALSLNKLEVQLVSKNMPKSFVSLAHHVDDFFKAYFYPYMKNSYEFNYQSKNATVNITLQIPLSRKELVHQLDLSIQKPGEKTVFQGLTPNALLKGMLPLHVEYSTMDRTLDHALSGGYVKFCEVQKEWIRTFDNVSYKYPLGECSHLLTRDCSNTFPVQVLAREEKEGKSLNITVGDVRIHITPALEAFSDGVKLDIPLYHSVILKHSLKGEIIQIIRQKVSKLIVVAQKYGMKLLADRKNVQIQMSPMYWGRLCGLCGDMNGEASAELKDPQGCILNNAHQFGVSYAVQPCSFKFASQPRTEQCLTDDYNPETRPKFGGREMPPTSFGVKSQRPRYLNKVVSRGNDVCFSINPLPECPLKAKPTEFTTKYVGFHCVPRGRKTNEMIAESSYSVLEHLEHARVDFQQYVSYPSACQEIQSSGPSSEWPADTEDFYKNELDNGSRMDATNPQDMKLIMTEARYNISAFPNNITSLLEPSYQGHIIEGTPLPDTSNFPHQVRVLNQGSMCGGMIVTPYYVVTAAHCLQRGIGRARVQAGIGSRRVQTIEGRSTQHPNYIPPGRGPISSDIGFIRLDRPLQFNRFVQPAQIYCGREEMNAYVNISGYGIINFDNYGNSIFPRDTLYYAPQRVSKFYGYRGIEPPQQFLGLADPHPDMLPHKASCSGDSGGPASFMNSERPEDGWTVMGVTSFGFTGRNRLLQCGGIGPGGGPNAHDVHSYYTRTSSFCYWLKRNIPGLRTTLSLVYLG